MQSETNNASPIVIKGTEFLSRHIDPKLLYAFCKFWMCAVVFMVALSVFYSFYLSIRDRKILLGHGGITSVAIYRDKQPIRYVIYVLMQVLLGIGVMYFFWMTLQIF